MNLNNIHTYSNWCSWADTKTGGEKAQWKSRSAKIKIK